MSTLEPSTQGMVVPKQIGKRVMEIMEEKGKAFTQQALATRIGMGRQSLSLKLRGERDLYMFELRRIADALHLPLERIMQIDTYDDEKKLSGMFASLVDDGTASKIPPVFEEMLVLAQRLSEVAVGMTERCKTLNDLGRAYYYLRRYKEAQTTFLDAYELAKKIVNKTNNTEYCNLTLSNLLVILTLSSTPHVDSYQILDDIEQTFNENPNRLGVSNYVRAKIAENNGNIDEAIIHAKKSLECFQQTGNDLAIGKAEATLAHYEFLAGKYVEAKELLEMSVSHLAPYMYNWLISVKDYAKTLLKLQEYQQMEIFVEDALSKVDLQSSQFRDIVGKLKILLSICKNETFQAESVLLDKRVHVDVRSLAYQFLKRHCIENGDKDILMKYAIIEDELGAIKRDLLDEERF